MELRELEYVMAIAEEGSISRAAERLFMAQSSLSQALSQYEAELGTRLFIRTSSGVRPTYAGELFLQNAGQILQHYHRLKAELRETSLPQAGRIELGISTYRGTALLPPLLQRFHQEFPSVEVIVHEHDSLVLQKKIASGDLDLALVALLPGQNLSENIPVMQDEVLLAVHRSHPILTAVHEERENSGRAWIDIRDAADCEFILSDRFTILGETAHQLFGEAGFTPKTTCGYVSAPLAAALARQGLGLAFTYRSCLVPGKDTAYLSIGKEGYYVDLVLLTPPDGYESWATRALARMIRQYIEKMN